MAHIMWNTSLVVSNGTVLDLWLRDRWLDSQSGHNRMVSTWIADCPWAAKPSQYITNTKVNLAFHPSGVCKSSTGLSGWV